VRLVDIAGVGRANNFAQIVDPDGIAADSARKSTDWLHPRGAAPNEASICRTCQSAVAYYLTEIVDVMCPGVCETRQHSKANHPGRFVPDKGMQSAPCTLGRIASHLTTSVGRDRRTSVVARERTEILHATRATPESGMGVSTAAGKIRLACDQAADTDSGCSAVAAARKCPQILQWGRWRPKESMVLSSRDLRKANHLTVVVDVAGSARSASGQRA
jgi:hypothetical protein